MEKASRRQEERDAGEHKASHPIHMGDPIKESNSSVLLEYKDYFYGSYCQIQWMSMACQAAAFRIPSMK